MPFTAFANTGSPLVRGVPHGEDDVVQPARVVDRAPPGQLQSPGGDRAGALERQVPVVVEVEPEHAVARVAVLCVRQRDLLAGAPVAAQRLRAGRPWGRAGTSRPSRRLAGPSWRRAGSGRRSACWPRRRRRRNRRTATGSDVGSGRGSRSRTATSDRRELAASGALQLQQCYRVQVGERDALDDLEAAGVGVHRRLGHEAKVQAESVARQQAVPPALPVQRPDEARLALPDAPLELVRALCSLRQLVGQVIGLQVQPGELARPSTGRAARC